MAPVSTRRKLTGFPPISRSTRGSGVPMGNWDRGAIIKSPGPPQSRVGPGWTRLAPRVEASEDIPISSGLLHRGGMVGVISLLPPVSGESLWEVAGCQD